MGSQSVGAQDGIPWSDEIDNFDAPEKSLHAVRSNSLAGLGCETGMIGHRGTTWYHKHGAKHAHDGECLEISIYLSSLRRHFPMPFPSVAHSHDSVSAIFSCISIQVCGIVRDSAKMQVKIAM